MFNTVNYILLESCDLNSAKNQGNIYFNLVKNQNKYIYI